MLNFPLRGNGKGKVHREGESSPGLNQRRDNIKVSQNPYFSPSTLMLIIHFVLVFYPTLRTYIWNIDLLANVVLPIGPNFIKIQALPI
jgi:hypothetical protein